MAFVFLDGLTLRYGDVVAVKDVTLEIEEGEYCVLLGPSGCGKTSILRMIAGFVRPEKGRIYLAGRDITDLYPGDRGVSMIFQNFALYPHLTVFGNLAFPLWAAKAPKEEVRKRVEEIARMLHIEDLLDRYPRELSGGQQQRVAVGRALVRKSDLLLMDEPLGNIDAKLRVEMRAQLKRLQRDLGITVIHVTHDQLEAQAVADKIVVMNEGMILQIGSPEDVYYHPKNLFVAGFVGTPAMNFIEGEISKGTFLSKVFELPLPEGMELEDGREVVLGIRPEHLKISLSPFPGSLHARVYVVEPQGGEMIVDVRIEGMIWRVRCSREDLGSVPEQEQDVWIQIPPQLVHIFDKETGKAYL
jgi:multiple sugar transport system ATP-binding protein